MTIKTKIDYQKMKRRDFLGDLAKAVGIASAISVPTISTLMFSASNNYTKKDALIYKIIKIEKKAKETVPFFKNLAVYLQDYNTGEIISHNAEELNPSASLIKPLIASVYSHHSDILKSFSEKKEKLDKEARYMLKNSYNPSTNVILQNLGGPNYVTLFVRDKFRHCLSKKGIIPVIKGNVNFSYIPLKKSEVKYLQREGWNSDFYMEHDDFYRSLISAGDLGRYIFAVENNLLYGSNKIKRSLRSNKVNRFCGFNSIISKNITRWCKTGTHGKMYGVMGVAQIKNKQKYGLVVMVNRGKSAPYNPEFEKWKKSAGGVTCKIIGECFKYVNS
jgi:hypothetical protein